MTRGDIVVCVLTGRVGKVFERWGPSSNTHYVDYVVIFPDFTSEVIKLRHLRHAMFGERLKYNSEQHKKKTA